MKNIMPNYRTWDEPATPKYWRWLIFIFLCVITNFLLMLLMLSSPSNLKISDHSFWIKAILPGFLIGLFISSGRITLYALKQVYWAVNVFCNNEDLHTREKMACEAAGIYRHCLIGPSGMKNIDWLAVQAGTIAKPQGNQGVLRNMLNKSEIPAQDIFQRQQILSEELASKLLTWPENEYLSDILVWIGHEGAWEQFKTTCHSAGIMLPKQVITNNHNPEIMDWIIDRLYDEKYPCKKVLCIGMHCPEHSPLSESDVTPKAEWAFCLLLGLPDQRKVLLTRPVEIYHSADFKRSQKNATMSGEPIGGYLQIAENLWPEAAEASWMKTPGRLLAHWGDTHPYTPWLTLLLAIIFCEEKKQPFGWLAEANSKKWAGIVTLKDS